MSSSDLIEAIFFSYSSTTNKTTISITSFDKTSTTNSKTASINILSNWTYLLSSNNSLSCSLLYDFSRQIYGLLYNNNGTLTLKSEITNSNLPASIASMSPFDLNFDAHIS